MGEVADGWLCTRGTRCMTTILRKFSRPRNVDVPTSILDNTCTMEVMISCFGLSEHINYSELKLSTF